jgi:hypothetical protein
MSQVQENDIPTPAVSTSRLTAQMFLKQRRGLIPEFAGYIDMYRDS